MSDIRTKVMCDVFDCLNNDGDYCRCTMINLQTEFCSEGEVLVCNCYIEREKKEPLLTREEVDTIGKRLEKRKKADEGTHSKEGKESETQKP